MKKKIFEKLKTLYADKGLNEKELEGLADIASKNLTDESTEEEINNAVGSIEPYIGIIQKVGNRMVTNAVKKFDGWIPKPKPTPEPEPNPEPNPEPKAITAEEIQRMIAESVTNALKPYKEKEEKDRLDSILFSHSKVKDIPDIFKGKYHLEKEEDLENLATTIENDFASFKQELVRSGVFVEPPKPSEDGDIDEDIAMLRSMGKSDK